MSANISDYFNKASNMNGSYPPVATVTSARAVGGATLSCDDLGGWATDTPVHFSTFKVSADGTIDTTTQTDWKGIVVGNTITEMTRLAGAADSGNASGDKVELNPTIGWLDDLVTGLLVSHKQNGALKDSVVTESTIATGAVTNSKIGSAAVKSSNVDWSTMACAAKCIISARISNNTAINAANTVPLSHEEAKIGSGISVNTYTGQFVVGSGINYVLAFASWTCSPDASGFKRVHIRKNGTMTDGYAFTTTDVTTGYLNGSVAGILISVNEGDIIDLYNRDTKMTFWTGTRMSIIAY